MVACVPAPSFGTVALSHDDLLQFPKLCNAADRPCVNFWRREVLRRDRSGTGLALGTYFGNHTHQTSQGFAKPLMNARILLASGFVALAIVIGVLIMTAKPDTPAPASLAEVQVVADKVIAAKPKPAAAKPAPAQDERFVIKRILPIDGPIKYGEWHWDEAGAPAGQIVITVDLEARVLSVFRGGYEIGATAVLLGTGEKPTPLGVFPITQKNKDHFSNIYTGAPMPYMQRLTDDGITLHGSKVELGYASHGCVGMPEPFAAKLFATTHIGDKVYITRGKQVGVGDNLVGG